MNREIDSKTLKILGIALKDTSLLQMAYEQYRALALLPLKTSMQLLVIDLNNLPTKPIPFKEVFIRWMLQANESRMINNEEPIMSYELAKMCPIWKIIKMPVRSVTMSRDKIMQAPKLKIVRQQAQPKGINSKSSGKRK
jgi:hypothetical protein